MASEMPAGDDAPVLYMVRAWVCPQEGQRYLDWLETKHMVEVVAQPGILWARKIALEQTDSQGWKGHLLIYGVADRDALSDYFESPARDGFWHEVEAFADVHYAERFWGSTDFAVGD